MAKYLFFQINFIKLIAEQKRTHSTRTVAGLIL